MANIINFGIAVERKRESLIEEIKDLRMVTAMILDEIDLFTDAETWGVSTKPMEIRVKELTKTLETTKVCLKQATTELTEVNRKLRYNNYVGG